MSVGAAEALRIAFEDEQVGLFIRTCFQAVEKKPEVVSRRWLSRQGGGYTWNVALVERLRQVSSRQRLLNAALVEIDGSSGKILRRHFLRSLFADEFEQKYLRNSGETLAPQAVGSAACDTDIDKPAGHIPV